MMSVNKYITPTPVVAMVAAYLYAHADGTLHYRQKSQYMFSSTAEQTISVTLVQGTVAYSAGVGQLPHGNLMYNNSGGNGDNFNIPIAQIPSGTYTLFLRARTNSNEGILEISIDASSKGTQDLYSAAQAENNVFSFSCGALAGGAHTINVKCSGKNALSSGFIVQFQEISLVKTA